MMEYQRLGNSGLKISKVILGCMQFGKSVQLPWALPEDEALPMLKYAFDAGINTWDTSDVYSFGHSERIIGKALKHYDIRRERVTILTKCYAGVPDSQELDELDGVALFKAITDNDGFMVNRVGLSRKHILDAVDASIKRLGTHIDVLQIHRLDRNTPREEIMRALNDVVESGKVRYLGASTMSAWEFQALNNIAERNGWHKFISMQNHHSLLHREEEREMMPYCRDVGIGIIPWSPLARGSLARPYAASINSKTERQKTDAYGFTLIGGLTAEDEVIINRVEELAKRHGSTMAQVSIAWSLSKGVNPILGLGSTERVDEAVKALQLNLTESELAYLEEPYVPKAPIPET